MSWDQLLQSRNKKWKQPLDFNPIKAPVSPYDWNMLICWHSTTKHMPINQRILLKIVTGHFEVKEKSAHIFLKSKNPIRGWDEPQNIQFVATIT